MDQECSDILRFACSKIAFFWWEIISAATFSDIMSLRIKQPCFRKEADMIMQIIKFRSTLSLDEVQKIAQERKEEFLAVPGLVQ